jgi:hypothetical protein
MRADLDLQTLRSYFENASIRAVLLGDLVTETIAAELRERVLPGLRPYWLPDRGRYHVNDAHVEPELFASLAELASAIAETPLVAGRARWVRLVRGDYALYKDDSRRRANLPAHLEMVLDVSAAPSDDAQIVYTNLESTFWIPQRPLGGALVDRRPPVQRYDRYLTHRVGDAEVFRLNLVLEVSSR